MCGMVKGGGYFNGTCHNCHQHGHAWRHCPEMSEQDKIAVAAKKGVNYKGATKGGSTDQGGKGAALVAGAGTTERVSQNQWGKGWQLSGNRSYGKGFGKKGLNEMGGNGWDSDDVRDLNGIPSAGRRSHFGSEGRSDGMSCGRSGESPRVRPLEPDSFAEQVHRVPGDGRRREELGAQRQ